MKVYVAGSTRDLDRVRSVQNLARSLNHEITFDWTGSEGEIRIDGSWDVAHETGSRVAQTEIAACLSADLTILLFPPNGGGLGCWIEMGASLASGSQVWVVSPGRDSVFWQHPLVSRFSTLEDLSHMLTEVSKSVA